VDLDQACLAKGPLSIVAPAHVGFLAERNPYAHPQARERVVTNGTPMEEDFPSTDRLDDAKPIIGEELDDEPLNGLHARGSVRRTPKLQGRGA
jgi:hypothetical protein